MLQGGLAGSMPKVPVRAICECFASVGAKQTIQELVRPADDTGDVEASPELQSK
jgi:hypothetical protein